MERTDGEEAMSYVLIVDDDKQVADAIADMVSLLDRQTKVVHSPRAAMLLIQQRPPDLMLLDLNMPGVNGIEVLGFIKRDPLARDIPVVFVTAEDDPETKERVRAAGALDYLVKPVDLDQLEAIFAKLEGLQSGPIRKTG
ncbi:MAG: hypothetical protein Kow00124_07020 [Anaerolineae bacterium]